MSDSTYTVTQAQARLPRLLNEDSFAITVHGEVKGYYLSKARLEAMIESVQLLENPNFATALKAHKEGGGKLFTSEEVDKELSQ